MSSDNNVRIRKDIGALHYSGKSNRPFIQIALSIIEVICKIDSFTDLINQRMSSFFRLGQIFFLNIFFFTKVLL